MEAITMAKKDPPSYDNLTLGTPDDEPTTTPVRQSPRAGRGERRTLKEASAQTVIYLHPAAAKALKRYALDKDVKAHDLLIEAVEAWFQAHGLKGPVRAETARRK